MIHWLRKLWSARKQELPDVNPPPTHPDYEVFHVTANKKISIQTVTVLKESGIRINETVWNQIGHPEYVIEVHKDDLSMAEEALWKNLGPSKSFMS